MWPFSALWTTACFTEGKHCHNCKDVQQLFVQNCTQTEEVFPFIIKHGIVFVIYDTYIKDYNCFCDRGYFCHSSGCFWDAFEIPWNVFSFKKFYSCLEGYTKQVCTAFKRPHTEEFSWKMSLKNSSERIYETMLLGDSSVTQPRKKRSVQKSLLLAA